MFKLFKLLFVLILAGLLISCNKHVELKHTSYDLFGFAYDPNKNLLKIHGKTYSNVVEVSESGNRRYIIFSRVESIGYQPEVFLKDTQTKVITKLTDNQYIEFDLAVNNKGDYAFSIHKKSVSKSILVLNGKELDLSISFYSKSFLTDDYLISNRLDQATGNSYLNKVDINNKALRYFTLPIVIDEIGVTAYPEILLSGVNLVTFKKEFYKFNLQSNYLSLVNTEAGSQLCSIMNGEVSCKKYDSSRQLMIDRGMSWLLNSDPLSSLACSSNSLGRLGWHSSYRLNALVDYRDTLLSERFPVDEVINNQVSCILENFNSSHETITYGWPAEKYSLNYENQSFLVDNSVILFSLLKAVNKGILKRKYYNAVRSIAVNMFTYYEKDWVPEKSIYRIRKGVPFWADGVWAPWNWSNSFGLVLLELYKLTNNIQYFDRALKIYKAFKKEWVTTEDGRILWHYWPGVYYDGWTYEDDVSINTPVMVQSVDYSFEDLSHSSLNVKFLLEMKLLSDYFNIDLLSETEISQLVNTIEYTRQEGGKYSRYMSGDVNKRPADREFMPSHSGWIDLDSEVLNLDIREGYIRKKPFFEGDLLHPLLFVAH